MSEVKESLTVQRVDAVACPDGVEMKVWSE